MSHDIPCGASSTGATPGAACLALPWTPSKGTSSAKWKLNGSSPNLAFDRARPSPPKRLGEAFLRLCATPLAKVEEFSSLNRVPASTPRDRLANLNKRRLGRRQPPRPNRVKISLRPQGRQLQPVY